MRLQNYKKTNEVIMVAPDIPAREDVVVYDEYRIDHNTVLRYMSVCTPDFPVYGYNNDVYSALILLNEDGVDTETKFIYDISRDGAEAHRIMKLLSENGVTPDTAVEILTEIL
jgi:hypothetical protein